MVNRIMLTAVALTAALLLTGCTEVRSIGEKARIDLAIQRLTSELDEQYGVALASTTAMDADYRYAVTVTIDSAQISPQNRDEVIRAVDETLAGSAFASTTRWFSIGTDVEPYYSQNVFGLDTLQSDLEYWHAVEDAVGEVTFSLSEPSADGPITRSRGVYKPTPMDYGALASIALDPTALDSWGSPGVGAEGTLPSRGVAAALADVSEMVPLYDYAEPNQPAAIQLMWSSQTNSADWTLHSSSLSDLATAPAASADWPVAVAVVSRLAANGIRESHFGYFSPFGAGGIVHLGDCRADVTASPVDVELFDGLLAAGVVLPEGSAAGWCQAT